MKRYKKNRKKRTVKQKMNRGAESLAAWVRKEIAKQGNPNKHRVRRIGKKIGWVKARAVRVLKKGNKIDVQVKR